MRKALALALSAAAISAIMAIGPAGAANNNEVKGTAFADCIDQTTGEKEGTFSYNGVTVAWPPNHKYREATITLTDDDDEPLTDDVTITTSGTHDQVLENGQEFVGTGNTDPITDVTPGAGMGNPSASAVFFFRGERSGTERDGRTYTFTANGTTDSGMSTCEPVTFEAYVPHDQRK